MARFYTTRAGAARFNPGARNARSAAPTRVGGTISEAERAFFAGTSPPRSRATTAASKRFLRQSFKVGQVHALTPDEIAGLGLGMSSVDLTVAEVTAAAVVFEIKTAGELSAVGATMKATGTLRVFDGGRELTQDGELLRDARPVGTLHVEQRSRAL